jgi:sugar lactone lactonase YvrE
MKGIFSKNPSFNVAPGSGLAGFLAATAALAATALAQSPLPSPLVWLSTGPLITAASDSTHSLTAIKDPTVVQYGGKWYVYASDVDAGGGYNMLCLSFTDWSEAGSAQQTYLNSANPNLAGYHCAPELFFFRPGNKWYLIYQSGPPTYSTTDDITKPETWSAPQYFFASQPSGAPNSWLDFWVICDDTNAYLFFSGDDGRWYRSQTAIGDFPSGLSNPVVVMEKPNPGDLFEASCVYRLKGTTQYLALIECMASTGHRYFKSFLADSLDGAWQPLAASENKPFLGSANVGFEPGTRIWAHDFSHGELLRDGYDETLTVDPANLQFLYQSLDVNTKSGLSYNQLPWQLALARRVNAAEVVTSPYAAVTLAGAAGGAGSADGTGSSASFHSPADLALDNSGNVFVADTANHLIREVSSAGVVSTVAGRGGISGSSDGMGTNAQFNQPAGIAVDGAGNVYVADTNNYTIRKITASGSVTTLAGQAGTSGNLDGPGTAALFNRPSGIAVDGSGNIYVADTLNHTIRQITSAGAVTTIAGTAGASGAVDATGAAARFYGPQGLVVDGAGNLFIADTNNNAIRKLATASGAVTTVAGQGGIAGSTDGTTSEAQFHFPSGVGLDSSGNVYVVDTDNHTLRQIATAGTVSTLAGLAGTSGSVDGVGTAARFNFPTGVVVNGSGDAYVADTNNHAVRLCVVPAAPAITAQPQSQSVNAGTSVNFSVTVTGKPTPTYQWLREGSAIAGATGSTCNLSNVQAADAGNYTVVVTNLAGSVTSAAATLSVSTPTTTIPQSDGGGGGAPSDWFCGGLLLLAAARIFQRQYK